MTTNEQDFDQNDKDLTNDGPDERSADNNCANDNVRCDDRDQGKHNGGNDERKRAVSNDTDTLEERPVQPGRSWPNATKGIIAPTRCRQEAGC